MTGCCRVLGTGLDSPTGRPLLLPTRGQFLPTHELPLDPEWEASKGHCAAFFLGTQLSGYLPPEDPEAPDWLGALLP